MSRKQKTKHITIVCSLFLISFALVTGQESEETSAVLSEMDRYKLSDNVGFMTDILEQRVEEIKQLNSNFKPSGEPRVSQLMQLQMKIENLETRLEEMETKNKKIEVRLEESEHAFLLYSLDIQKLISYVDAKSPVYFYVKKNKESRENGVINFEIEVVNIGGAMNARTGYFVAPKNGTYFFIFSATMYFENKEHKMCSIALRGLEKGVEAAFGSEKERSSATSHVISYLEAGDKVFLDIPGYCRDFVLYNDGDWNHYFTHFFGGLLKEIG